MRRPLRLWLGLAISLLCFGLAAQNQRLDLVLEALALADYRWLVPAIGLYFVGVYVRTLRWQALLTPVRRLSIGLLLPLVVIGYMANNVLPARIGELVRAYALNRRSGIGTGTGLATIAIERIFDGLTMVLFIVIASNLVQLNGLVAGLAFLAAALFGCLLAGLTAIVWLKPVQRLVFGLLGRLLPGRLGGRLIGLATSFIDGLSGLRSRAELVRVVLTSVVAWFCEAGMYILIGWAFGLDLGWPVALMTTAVANLFTLVPSSPGYVGIFEAGVLAVLVGLIGLPETAAFSYALVLHAALWLPVTLLGILLLPRESLNWRALRALEGGREITDAAERSTT